MECDGDDPVHCSSMGKQKIGTAHTTDLISADTCRLSKRRTRQAAQKMSYEILPSCYFDNIPRRERSKRGINDNDTISRQEKKLDTHMFESYLENLWRDVSEDKRNSFAYLDCLWFSLYKTGSESDKTKVLKWIEKLHIFSRKYVFVPIICWDHWSLLILCHLGENLHSKTKTPCMLLLDSLRIADPRRLEPAIRKFVLDIYTSEGRREKKELIPKIPFLVPEVPQQRNGEECGIFVLYFINLFLQNAPKNFSIFKGYPYFLKENWFDFEGLESFYKQIRSSAIGFRNP